jgi:Cu/Ag efflux protein CusF
VLRNAAKVMGRASQPPHADRSAKTPQQTMKNAAAVVGGPNPIEGGSMSKRTHGTVLAVAACFLASVAGCSSMTGGSAPAVPAEPVKGVVSENLVSTTATVKAVDQKTRHVTLQRADGELVKFRADDSVRNLPQVKVGDEVTVSYYESLAYEVRKSGEVSPGATVAEAAGRAEPGEKPGAAGVRAVTVTATIAAIDKKAMTVTLKDADGELTTVKARDPQKLDRVAVGDIVDITYTEAVAVKVEAPGAQ